MALILIRILSFLIDILSGALTARRVDPSRWLGFSAEKMYRQYEPIVQFVGEDLCIH